MPYPDHWTDRDRADWCEAANAAARASLARACVQLNAVAASLDALPPRLGRKLRPFLSAERIRNEAERGRDTLHVYRLGDELLP